MTGSSNRDKRRVRAPGAPEPPRYERLAPPLHTHLATFDPHNARIKLFREDPGTVGMPESRHTLQNRFDSSDAFSKLTVYAADSDHGGWTDLGFEKEARIAGFFRDGSDAELWVRYSDSERAVSLRAEEEDGALNVALGKEAVPPTDLPGGYTARFAVPEDADTISALLKTYFPEYPVSLDPESIRPVIARQNAVYRLVEHGAEIVAMANAELDLGRSNAEISDCVTVEDHRGKGLMVRIIHDLIGHVSGRFGIRDFFSLARATEVGMNVALARSGFAYDGRLVNNCRMPEGWESMNVWCRTERHGDE